MLRTLDTIAHAELKIAGNLIMLGSGDGAPAVYIALETPGDVDACYARAKAAGAEVVRELTDTVVAVPPTRNSSARGWL